MEIWPPHTILNAIQMLLSHPLVLVEGVLSNLFEKASWIYVLISEGRTVRFGIVWELIKWTLLALLIFGLIIYICIDTVKRVMFAELEKKNLVRILKDIIFILLVLFTYYVILSVGLYLFFSVILPISREL